MRDPWYVQYAVMSVKDIELINFIYHAIENTANQNTVFDSITSNLLIVRRA